MAKLTIELDLKQVTVIGWLINAALAHNLHKKMLVSIPKNEMFEIGYDFMKTLNNFRSDILPPQAVPCKSCQKAPPITPPKTP